MGVQVMQLSCWSCTNYSFAVARPHWSKMLHMDHIPFSSGQMFLYMSLLDCEDHVQDAYKGRLLPFCHY